MPEGPSIVILKEATQQFAGKVVREVSGSAKIDLDMIIGKKVISIRSFGKHFLIEFKGFSIRIHMLLFGSYTINEEKENRKPRLHLGFDNGYFNSYASAVKIIDQPLEKEYDFTADVMNEKWSKTKALKKLQEIPDELVCDVLLDQDIFAGVGNIIKNEVLYRIKVHPASTIGNLPLAKQKELIREARNYSFDFLKWKKDFTLSKHWLAHKKKMCPIGHGKLEFKNMGKRKRNAFYCEKCQVKY